MDKPKASLKRKMRSWGRTSEESLIPMSDESSNESGADKCRCPASKKTCRCREGLYRGQTLQQSDAKSRYDFEDDSTSASETSSNESSCSIRINLNNDGRISDGSSETSGPCSTSSTSSFKSSDNSISESDGNGSSSSSSFSSNEYTELKEENNSSSFSFEKSSSSSSQDRGLLDYSTFSTHSSNSDTSNSSTDRSKFVRELDRALERRVALFNEEIDTSPNSSDYNTSDSSVLSDYDIDSD